MGFSLKPVINFIFPPVCSICKTHFISEEETGICPHCLSEVKYIGSPLCILCGKPFYSEVLTDHLCGDCITGERYFSKARAVGYYDGVLRKAIHLFKYKLKIYLSLTLGNIMSYQMQYLLKGDTYHSIIPVPLHPKRLRERGFNQALFLARSVSRKYEIPLDRDSLTRDRWTKPQVGLSERERKNNVKNAFYLLNNSKVKDKDILLVDDVYTSGNTAEECSRVLLEAGAQKVDVLTLARVA